MTIYPTALRKHAELILPHKLSEIDVIRVKMSHGLKGLSIHLEWDIWFSKRMKREKEEDEGGRIQRGSD